MPRNPTPREKIKIKRLAVGDRALIGGQVLRVLEGDRRPLLILLDDSPVKITLPAQLVQDGENLRGGDAVTLGATITRIGESLFRDEDHAPVSLSIDGYTAARVTVPRRAIGRVE